jgi:hypothetical protein
VSYLIIGRKLLEKVVCDQVTDFTEKQKLPSDNQYGFRAKRSTMKATMQQE